jgi:hypothetical protein
MRPHRGVHAIPLQILRYRRSSIGASNYKAQRKMILKKAAALEKYPLRFIIVRNALNVALFCTGALLMSFISNLLLVIYLAYCFCTIIWLLKIRVRTVIITANSVHPVLG